MDFASKLIKLLLLSFPLSALFYYALYRIYKHLLGSIPSKTEIINQHGQSVWRNGSVLALGVFTGLTIIYFPQYLGSISTALIGTPEDNMQNLWNFWWGFNVITGKMGEFASTKFLLYPEGTSLLYHSYSWYNLFLSFLLRHIHGPVLAYNLLILHTYILSGLGAFLLARYLLGNIPLALVAGFIFAFSPAHFAHHTGGHINIASIQFIPFFVLYFIKAIKEGGLKNILLGALFLFLNTICSWNHMIFAFFFMALSYIYLTIRRRRLLLIDVATKSVFLSFLALIPISPWLVRMIIVGLKYPGALAVGHNYYVSDLLGFITPDHYHTLSNISLIKAVNDSFTGNVWETAVYFGLVALAIIIFVFKKIKKETARYLLALISFIILSMGSTLHIVGYSTPILLPYRILFLVPFLSNIRCPSRHILYGYLFLGIILAMGIKYLYSSVKLGKYKNYILTALIVLILVDYYPVEKEMTPVYLPSCYNVILRDSEIFAILDLPSGYVESNTYMMYQTLHEHPIVQGVVSRKLHETLRDRLNYTDLYIQKQQLASDSVKYIIIHKTFLEPDDLVDTLEYSKTYTKIYSDSSNIVFQVQ